MTPRQPETQAPGDLPHAAFCANCGYDRVEIRWSILHGRQLCVRCHGLPTPAEQRELDEFLTHDAEGNPRG